MSGAIRPFAVGFGVLTLAACGTPDLNTNLRPEGDPEVLAVMIQVDELSLFEGLQAELATYCKPDDDKVPTIIGQPDFSVVQVCPEPGTDDPPVSTVTNAAPLNWYARVVFDELLNPDFEDLTDSATGGPCTDTSETCDGHIAGSHPVELECNGQAVDYDGYYSPNGNSLSWPPGPSIVVIPNVFVATSTECTIALNDVIEDKDGNAIPADQRGPFDFAVAGLDILFTDPEETDPVTEVPTDYELAVGFNASIDATSIDATDITLTDAADAPVAFTLSVDPMDDTLVLITPDAPLAVGDYTLTIPMGATFSDIEGGTLTTDAAITVPFTVVAA